MFKLDGTEYINAVVNIERSFNILDGENAGRLLLTAKMDRDVLGTFYNYAMTIDRDFITDEEYDEIYETLSAPVDFHTIEVPYGQDVLVYEAYVTKGKDKLKQIYDYEKNTQSLYWNELSIEFIAMEPQRRPA